MEGKKQNRNLEQQSYNSIDELYKSITKEGSLGLLALGYQGLMLWRKKRIELGEVFPPQQKGTKQVEKED